MGFLDNLKRGFTPPQDDDYDYEGDDYGYGDDDYVDEAPVQQNNRAPQPAPAGRSGSMGINGALEMKVVKPDKYDSATAQKIADHLLSDRTVVLNLESTNKESARRLIDFLSGVAYSIDGYIQRVANNTFVIVPKNVDVSGEQLQEVRKQEETDLF
ncbi:MAG: cell division protein SepF [Clostridia bacterium]|nr:cell division protein SepF [Clostridia bacterium]